MKTAVPIPDEIFSQADALAEDLAAEHTGFGQHAAAAGLRVTEW